MRLVIRASHGARTSTWVPAHAVRLARRWIVGSIHRIIARTCSIAAWTEQGIDLWHAKHFSYGVDYAVWASQFGAPST